MWPIDAYKHPGKQCFQARKVAMHERNERTNEQLLTLGSYLTLGIARRGVARISPKVWMGKLVSASASRGLAVEVVR